ncbi:hypothetical protein Tco_0442812 [Tanacetum coccineum]
MVDHSPMWHEGAANRRRCGGNSEGLAAITTHLSNLGREMRMLSKWVHTLQVGCEHCHGPHLSKDCPKKEEVIAAEEVSYDEENKKEEASIQKAVVEPY